jgi:hypothetical protein
MVDYGLPEMISLLVVQIIAAWFCGVEPVQPPLPGFDPKP